VPAAGVCSDHQSLPRTTSSTTSRTVATGQVREEVMSKKLGPCPDCGAPIGELHRTGCDTERCPHCGWQALGCAHFDPNDARRQAWNGKWPGEDDCERLGFFVNGDPDFPDSRRHAVGGWIALRVSGGQSRRRGRSVNIRARISYRRGSLARGDRYDASIKGIA
jgi:predicted RNA-binding Zn-ribbon protein involved in translation (DUF1610 family)